MDAALYLVDKAVWPWRAGTIWLVQTYFRLWKYGLFLIGSAVMLPFEILAAARREEQTRARLLMVEKQAEIAAVQAQDLERKLEASQRERRRTREKLEECLADRRRLKDRVRELQGRGERLEREKLAVEIEAAAIRERSARAELEVAAAARIVGQRAVEAQLGHPLPSEEPSPSHPEKPPEPSAATTPSPPPQSHFQSYLRWLLSSAISCAIIWCILNALNAPKYYYGILWSLMVLPSVVMGGAKGWVGEFVQGVKWVTVGFAACHYVYFVGGLNVLCIEESHQDLGLSGAIMTGWFLPKALNQTLADAKDEL